MLSPSTPLFGDSLNSIGIIVFSRDRHKELREAIKYWSPKNFHVTIFHNSSVPIQKRYLPLHIEYHQTKGLDLGKRAALARDQVLSEYSIICSDDERLLETGLAEMRTFMDQHPEMMSIGARVLSSFRYGPRITGSFIYEHMNKYSNINLNLEKRLEEHLSLKNNRRIVIGGMYRLFRKSAMQDLLDGLAVCSGMKSPYTYQYMSEVVVGATGATKNLDCLYWIRNWDNGFISHKNWDRDYGISRWWISKESASEVEHFIEFISKRYELESRLVRNLLTKLFLECRSYEQVGIAKKQINFPLVNYTKYLVKKIIQPALIPSTLQKVLIQDSEISEENALEALFVAKELMGAK